MKLIAHNKNTKMDIHIIPVQDKYLIYRPLRRLAFIGNRAMADLALQYSTHPSGILPEGSPEAFTFLKSIGFTRPDPPPPSSINTNKLFKPTSAALLMTDRCNLRCIYCYASGGEKGNLDLSPDSARTVIDLVYRNALEMNQPSFDVTFHGGGEPSLAWETLQGAASYARTLNLPSKLHMVSNGVWNRSRREWVVANLDGLTISMDGGRITQDTQRPFPSGRGSFKAVMQTIRFLDHEKFSYNIRITTTPERFEYLPEDVDFICKETGCKNIQVEPCFQSRRGAHHPPAQNQVDTFSEAFLTAYDIANSAKRFIYYSGARPWLLTTAFCTAPLGNTLTINPRGEIVACYEITNQDHPLAQESTFGIVNNPSAVLKIDDEKRSGFLTYINNRRSACLGCFCYWHCAGDCYTRAFEKQGNINSQPYARCAVNQAITVGLLLRYIANSNGVYRGNLANNCHE